ncbi:RNA polymerase sigma factor [Novosphingobium rosa]|uniref:RNA polymerase sigma factor n=1 Tax=Novosphingobium rosa TaxID=76978 RepID=UPI0008316FD6|nr:sigma-70 family RNA polymerase sigma factor [Novosphingobium rosa]
MPDSGLLQTFLPARPELLRFLRLRGAMPDEAEDILQSMGLKLAEQETGPVDQPRAYLYRMATNEFLLHRRGDARRRRRDESWVDAQSGFMREVDPQPSAETVLIASQHLHLLQGVITAMPERTATIFRLFRLDGVPQKTIAADLGISVSAVEKHLARAYLDILQARKKFDEESGPARHPAHEQGHHHD